MDEAVELKTAFCRAFDARAEPQLCRAPGRVNIIGEHTDYNGLPALSSHQDRCPRTRISSSFGFGCF